jgi:predicted nucleic acid-binding protein
MMIIVSNTSPISNLANVGQLSLMSQLYGRILIPCAVYEELLDPRAGETVITAVRSASWIDIQSVQNHGLVNDLRTRVNVGEAEAIALAIEVKAARLIIDERLGRQAARDFGVKITGVLGILLLAKRQKIIMEVKPIMDNLMEQANFRISSQLYADVLMAADESVT